MVKYLQFSAISLILLLGLAKNLSAQTNYMEQNFSGGGPFISANPDPGQFSHLVSTNEVLSKYEFGPGYMDLIRLQQDSATGGIVRALRAVPFSPNPETLYIQITFSVEEIGAAATNALYFYSGENFSPTNNKIPANALLFSRFSLNFLASSFVVHDIETGKNSTPLPLHTPVTLTWVLNNSSDGQIYRKPETAADADYKVMPGKYDLWVNETLQVNDADAYPGTSAYSLTKLSNFEIRFRNGVGKVRFTSLRIRDVTGVLPLHIISFKVENEPGKVKLYWETDNVRISDHYTLSKRKERGLFETIGYVTARENPGNTYFFEDVQPDIGVSHYRVELFDQYGKRIDSRETALTQASEISVSPNPASSSLVRVNYMDGEPETIKIYDLNGREQFFRSETWNNGFIEMRPHDKITPGLYILSISRKGLNKYFRFWVE
jgi:hypothetical protein